MKKKKNKNQLDEIYRVEDKVICLIDNSYKKKKYSSGKIVRIRTWEPKFEVVFIENKQYESGLFFIKELQLVMRKIT